MSRIALRHTLAGLSMAITAGLLSAPTIAATTDAPAATQSSAAKATPDAHKGPRGERHGRHGHHMGRDGMMIPGLGPVSKAQLDTLKLDANQQGLVQQARDAQLSLFKAHREAGAGRHQLLDKQLADGKLDPRALMAASEANRDQFRTQAGQVRDKWLAVWDSLNDTQRGQVAELVKAREARMKDRQEKRAERVQQWRAEHAQQPAAAAS
ncbi:Uncharacterised protein [Bordetella ansorpii]|uniref:Periplasmic protein n=1 Tax=Bordetella ansorpii TaxID=288768 RepID=A0A157SW33_9BORD|nr:hypothetical protein [Bordetella ansorpii]SAI74678.1 Uncharacterised protein [Bordetella ansorpii]